MIHALRAFQYRNFRLYFFGQSLSLLGTWTQQVAMSWLVYRLTGSAFLLGVTAFASQIPILFFAPLGGLWADRFDRRKLFIATQAFAVVQALALAALTYSNVIEVWQIIVMAVLLGVVMATDTPVRQSFVTELVPSKTDLPGAIAMNGLVQNAGRMIGPSIAGLLIAISSEAFCFLANGLSKIAVIVIVALMQIDVRAVKAASAPMLRGLKEGAVYAASLLPIRLLLPIVALISFMATPYQALMPIFAAEVFKGDARMLGFLIGAAGLGGSSGLLYLAARRDVRGLARLIAFGALLAGVSLMVFGESKVLWLSLAAIMLTGFGIILVGMGTSMIFQTIVADEKRGRVMSFFTVAFLGMSPLGSFVAGSLAHQIGAGHTLFAGGACCVIGAIVLWRQLPRLRADIRKTYLELGVGKP
ncbi:MAG: transporter [Betaproteobacteria bacterium]|nr:transporter [Betaproteobacteria bacterium]